MPNKDLAEALRSALGTLVIRGQALSTVAIDYFIGQEIKEMEIAAAIPDDLVGNQPYITAFVQAVHANLLAKGAFYNAASQTYNFDALLLTGPVARTAGEDLSAIKKYGDLNRCDLAKAITNVLRNIKAAERG